MAESPGVSVEDLNAVKTALEASDTKVSSLESKIDELTKLVSSMIPNKTVATISLEDVDRASKAAQKAIDEAKAAEGDPEKNNDSYHAVPPTFQSADPYINHPRINNIGSPPKVNTIDFELWQLEFRSYMCRSCNELWRIVEKGFHPQHDSDNYTRR